MSEDKPVSRSGRKATGVLVFKRELHTVDDAASQSSTAKRTISER